MDLVRWAVIGVGRFGMIHARVLSTLPGSRLVALATRDAARMEQAAGEFGASHTYTDYRRLLEDPEVDAVSITTHWQEHHRIAMDALAAGKHVLLEKPMAASSGQCRELLKAAERAAGSFMVGHICRFDPRVTLAKEAIDAGRIGRIVSMHARRNLPKAPGSLRLDKIPPLIGDGIHDADLMLWFTGQTPMEIYGRHVRVEAYKYADIGWAMLHFNNGATGGDEAIGVIETVWRLPENTSTVIDAKFEVIGTEGKLSIDCSNTGLTILDQSGLKMPDTVYWPMQHGRQVGALALELDYFARCIREGIPPSVITPLEAARAFAVVEAAERSAECRQPVLFEFE